MLPGCSSHTQSSDRNPLWGHRAGWVQPALHSRSLRRCCRDGCRNPSSPIFQGIQENRVVAVLVSVVVVLLLVAAASAVAVAAGSSGRHS